jgi:hypothetical protein
MAEFGRIDKRIVMACDGMSCDTNLLGEYFMPIL